MTLSSFNSEISATDALICEYFITKPVPDDLPIYDQTYHEMGRDKKAKRKGKAAEKMRF